MGVSELKIGGAVVFWTPPTWTDRAKLYDRLIPYNLQSLTPPQRGSPACLRTALEEYYPSSRHRVEATRKRTHFEVLEITRGQEENEYAPVLKASVADYEDGGRGITTGPWDQDRQDAIVKLFNQSLGLLSAPQVTQMLVAYVESLGGTRIRPNGGIYWLPAQRVAEYELVGKLVEASAHNGHGACYTIRHQMDEGAVRAVRDAIVAEVGTASKRLHEEILSGDLGERALSNRRDEANAIRDKIRLYEELLSVGLGHLRESVDLAEQASAAAEMLAGAGVE